MATTLAEAFREARSLEGPLRLKLAHYAAAMRVLAPPFAEAYDNLVASLVSGEVGSRAPRVGDTMPPFLLPNEEGSLVHSSAIFAQRPTVLSFNRGHWCPFCRLEISGLTDAADQIAARGGQIISITPEPAALLRRLRESCGAPFMFLSDIDNAYALEIGLVMRVDDHLRGLMRDRDLDFESFHGNNSWLLPLPATFVVDQAGVIRASRVDPDFRTRMEIDSILSALPPLG